MASCGCSIERLLRQEETYIFITGAQKQSDTPAGKSYIAYSIRTGVSLEFYSISVLFKWFKFYLDERINKINELTIIIIIII